jgi:hypothetical protein
MRWHTADLTANEPFPIHGAIMSNVVQSVPAAAAFQIPMPAQVGWALKLLWLSLAITTVPFWWNILPLVLVPPPNAPATSSLATQLAAPILSGCLNVMIARRKNWARITKLIWAAVSLMTTAFFVYPFLGQFQSIKIVIAPALEFGALYLLFFTSGRHWFRHPSSSKEV